MKTFKQLTESTLNELFGFNKKRKIPPKISLKDIEDELNNWRNINDGKLLPTQSGSFANFQLVMKRMIENGSLNIPRPPGWPIRNDDRPYGKHEKKAFNDFHKFFKSISYDNTEGKGTGRFGMMYTSNASYDEIKTLAKKAAKSIYEFSKEIGNVK